MQSPQSTLTTVPLCRCSPQAERTLLLQLGGLYRVHPGEERCFHWQCQAKTLQVLPPGEKGRPQEPECTLTAFFWCDFLILHDVNLNICRQEKSRRPNIQRKGCTLESQQGFPWVSRLLWLIQKIVPQHLLSKCGACHFSCSIFLPVRV